VDGGWRDGREGFTYLAGAGAGAEEEDELPFLPMVNDAGGGRCLSVCVCGRDGGKGGK